MLKIEVNEDATAIDVEGNRKEVYLSCGHAILHIINILHELECNDDVIRGVFEIALASSER